MRQWVLVGMERFRVSEAIRAYQEAEVDLREQPNGPGLPVAVLLKKWRLAKSQCSMRRRILGLVWRLCVRLGQRMSSFLIVRPFLEISDLIVLQINSLC